MKLVLFDVDGTLIDSQNIIVAAMDGAYAAHGRPAPERTAVLSVVGLSLPQAFAALGAGGPDLPIEGLAAAYKASFFQLANDPAHTVPLFPGALDGVRALAARGDIVLGLATGKSRRGVNRMIDMHALHGVFQTIQTADDHPSKPAPDMVLAAMAEAGARPQDTVLLGDTSFDMAMTRAAGALPLGAGWGYHPASELVSAGAQIVFDDFAAFMAGWEATMGAAA